MKRRDILRGVAAGTLAAAAPAKLFAQVQPGTVRDRKLFAIAAQQLEKAGAAIWRKDIVGIADFGLHSAQPRFHFVNLERQSVQSYLVAHGTGSDPEHDGWLNDYSNVEGSNATSRGAYVSWEWYVGKYGTSVRLGGLDPTNDLAFPRAIVMHSARYAEPEHVARWGRLGRSNGCFALSKTDFNIALANLSGGRLLYAESLGLAEDGSKVIPPPVPISSQGLEMTPEERRAVDAANAGVIPQ